MLTRVNGRDITALGYREGPLVGLALRVVPIDPEPLESIDPRASLRLYPWRGALVDLPHSKLGSFGHIRTPIDFSDEKIVAYRAPGIGEHSRQIAVDAAQIDASRVDELEAEGIFT